MIARSFNSPQIPQCKTYIILLSEKLLDKDRKKVAPGGGDKIFVVYQLFFISNFGNLLPKNLVNFLSNLPL